MQMDGHVIVAFDGEWDLARGEEFRDAITRTLADARSGDVLILDMREVTFADSTIIAGLHDGALRARASGVSLAVVCADGPLRRVFELVQLEALVPIAATIDDAVVRARAALAS